MEIKIILSSLPAKPFVFNHMYSIPSQMLGSSRNISTTQIGAMRTLLQFNIQNRLILTEFAVFVVVYHAQIQKVLSEGLQL